MDAKTLKHYASLDDRLVQAVRGVRVLQSMSWPQSVQKNFLDCWRRGVQRLPNPEYIAVDLSDSCKELELIAQSVDVEEPLGGYLKRSAESWLVASHMLEAIGTAAVSDHSIKLFGRPGEALPGNGPSSVDAAVHFISVADELDAELRTHEADYELDAEDLQTDLQQRLDKFFVNHKVDVVLDPELLSKAAAGPTRIRLRSGAKFTEYDRHQLREHEAFVHTLTALNGREQPLFKSLARTSPRIIATQEGLATFAELITGNIDIERMKRISLRIIAIDMALRGADFIEVFRFFIDAGQTEEESFASTQRVYRGVPLTGGAAFTKDAVYLHGLMRVHTFFRWCLRQRKLVLAHRLFAGKMSLEDLFELGPAFDEGHVAPAMYLPPWVKKANGLAGALAFSLFANKIRLDQVDADELILGL